MPAIFTDSTCEIARHEIPFSVNSFAKTGYFLILPNLEDDIGILVRGDITAVTLFSVCCHPIQTLIEIGVTISSV